MRKTLCFLLKDWLCFIFDQTITSIVNLINAQPTPLAICPGYIEYVLCVCA